MFTLSITDKLYAAMYGATLLPIIVTMAVYSSRLQTLSADLASGLAPFCALAPAQYETGLAGSLNAIFTPYVGTIDFQIVPMAQRWMCSEQCPCTRADRAAYSSMTPPDFPPYGRQVFSSEKNDADGTVRVVFGEATGDEDRDYFPATFYDCYFDWKAEWVAAGS